MALNQAPLNKETINGSATGNVYTQALSVVSSTTNSFLKGAAKTLSVLRFALFNTGVLGGSAINVTTIDGETSYTVASNASIVTNFFFYRSVNAVVTSTSSIVKAISKLFSVSVSSTASLIKALTKTLSVLVSSTVSILQAKGKLLTVSVTSNSSLLKYLGKIVLEVEVVAATILTAVNRLVTLLAYSSSSVSIKKAVNTTLSLVTSISTVTITTIRNLIRTITASVSSLVTIASARFYFRNLSVISSSVASIQNSWIKILTISVNCGIILSKLINKYINSSVTVLVSLLANVVSFINYPVDRLMYAADRIREATVTKFRTVFIDKDTRV